MGDTSSFDSYTKQEINNLLKNYYTKSEINDIIAGIEAVEMTLIMLCLQLNLAKLEQVNILL